MRRRRTLKSLSSEDVLALVSRVRHLLTYDPATGDLTWWNITSNRVKVGMRAGNVTCEHNELSVDGRSYRTTTVIWLLLYGRLPNGFIDHKNGNPVDDRLDNLREATAAQNAWNTRPHKDSKHGLKGVTFYPGRKSRPWQARICIYGNTKRLGYFETAEAAHAAYAAEALQLFGQFARAA